MDTKTAKAAPQGDQIAHRIPVCKDTESPRYLQGMEAKILQERPRIAEITAELGKALSQPAENGWEVFPNEQIIKPAYTLKIGEIGTLPRGDIQAIKAKSKSGKTFAASILAAVIMGATFGDLSPVEENANVLIFDTEQSRPNAINVLRRIYRLLGWGEQQPNGRIHFYALRKMDMAARRDFIAERTKLYNPTAIIIDGIADLMRNFNDVEESAALIDWLMKLSADNNCAVLCVLHENKSKDDNGMKGHLGTLLLQKSSDVFQCSRASGVFTVSNCDSRNVPTPDFSFSLDAHGLPLPQAAPTPQNSTKEKIRATLEKVSQQAPGMHFSYNKLVDAYSIQSACSADTAKRHIRMAKEYGFLAVGNDQKYKVVSNGVI